MKQLAIIKSIPFKLSVIASCMLLIISVCSEFLVYRDTTDSYLADLKNRQLNEAQELSKEIELKIKQRTRLVQVIAKLLSCNLMGSNDELETLMKNALNGIDLFPLGIFILRADEPDKIINVSSCPAEDVFASDYMEWFVLAKTTDDVVISKAFRFKSSGQLHLIFAKAIHDISGAIIGVLAAPVQISNQLLIDIANPNATDGLSKNVIIPELGEVVFAPTDKNQVLEPTPDQAVYGFYKDANALEGTGVITNTDGISDLVAFSTIVPMNWAVIVRTDIAKDIAQVREEFVENASTELLLLVFVNITVIFATLYFYFSPLRHSARQVRSMDLGGSLTPLSKIRNDEIGDLIDGFNGLVDAVNERTLELKVANQHLEELSRIDALTGVFNRRWFDHSLDRMWRVRQRSRKPLSLIILDIDFFKQYNDSYGHLEGDKCLAAVGKALKDSLKRPTDIFARYGGEEFAAIVENDEAGVLSLAEAMRQSIENLKVEHTKSPHGIVTISLGVATLNPGPNELPDLLIKYADNALYQSKEQGRNKVTAYSPDDDRTT